jgi:hypothetical protein
MEPSKPLEPSDSDHIGDWPKGRNRIETAAHVHAFGMIALNASMLEEVLSLLLVAYLPMENDAATKLVNEFNNRERAAWLSALVQKSESDPDVAEHVIHGILCCDINLANRNLLIHSLYVGTDKATESMRLSKRARNNPLRELRFEMSTSGLRKVADEIGDAVNYMLDLWFLKTQRSLLVQQLPWPAKPPRPERVTIPGLEAFR